MATHALLESARCYKKIPDRGEKEAASAALALEKATELSMGRKKLESAATCCRLLAELYEEQKEWSKAMIHFQDAAYSYGGCASEESVFYARHCMLKAREIAQIIADAEHN
ncbi:hypothetical protein OsI_04149 [Oryza sativa Indica Group]|uniref:Uncharacterized protein n=1 Tax=Oryza sativa subsp. indica TaxID=39946 RepID=A2WW67_ORYSI|nr:hypothetical protein OsI_04149 [Oryza sativa Indica Group]